MKKLFLISVLCALAFTVNAQTELARDTLSTDPLEIKIYFFPDSTSHHYITLQDNGYQVNFKTVTYLQKANGEFKIWSTGSENIFFDKEDYGNTWNMLTSKPVKDCIKSNIRLLVE